jgi:hypothetical protein
LKTPGIFNVFIGSPFSFTKKVHEIVPVLETRDDPGNELAVSSLPVLPPAPMCGSATSG